MCLHARTQHDQARKLLRRIDKNIGKIGIQGDQRSPLCLASIQQPPIRCAIQAFVRNSVDIMLRAEHVGHVGRKMLIKLEFQAALVVAMRSRASSAAYAIAASTSSLES